MPEGSDDSAESRGAQQSLYAGARNERNADSLCVTRELTAATNREPGHIHPDRDTACESVTEAIAEGIVSLSCEPSEEVCGAQRNTRLERIRRAV